MGAERQVRVFLCCFFGGGVFWFGFFLVFFWFLVKWVWLTVSWCTTFCSFFFFFFFFVVVFLVWFFFGFFLVFGKEGLAYRALVHHFSLLWTLAMCFFRALPMIVCTDCGSTSRRMPKPLPIFSKISTS